MPVTGLLLADASNSEEPSPGPRNLPEIYFCIGKWLSQLVYELRLSKNSLLLINGSSNAMPLKLIYQWREGGKVYVAREGEKGKTTRTLNFPKHGCYPELI